MLLMNQRCFESGEPRTSFLICHHQATYLGPISSIKDVLHARPYMKNGGNASLRQIIERLDRFLASNQSPSDIVFEDKDICILKPDSDRGIIIYHRFPKELTDTIAMQGLRLHAANASGARSVDHTYIFFRAPGAACHECGSHATLNDINTNYPKKLQMPASDQTDAYFCIRIDPTKTFVYSSECRVNYYGTEMWKNSRLSLQDYLNVIMENLPIKSNKYHVFSYRKVNPSCKGDMFTDCPPEFNAEILARCDIPPAWRVDPTT